VDVIDSASSDVLTPVADDIWLVDAGTIDAAGMPLPVRMVVIRLSTGELVLHSPTRYSIDLRRQLEAIGPIRYLLAPSIAHWMFLPDWQTALPNAQLLAVVGLGRRAQVRKSGLRIDGELDGKAPASWAGQLDTVLISAPPYAEIALYHRVSRTLILTDLVQNLDPERLPPWPRLIARQIGVTAPDGRAPVYLRLLVRLWGGSVSRAAARLVAFAPDRVLFSHGEWFDHDATARLRQSLRWLLPKDASQRPFDDGRLPAARQLSSASLLAGIGIGAGLAILGWALVRSSRRGRVKIAADQPARLSDRRPHRHDRRSSR
jgi:hypothetical protein